MKSLVVSVLLVIGCEQHTPPPLRHAAPPPPPADAGVAAVVIDAAVAHGATYCPGATPWPAGSKACTQDADCGPRGRCYPDGVPNYSGMCGVRPREVMNCASDSDCKHGYCDHEPERRGCEEVIESQCRPACTKTSCKAGEVCRKDGRCEIQQCTDGYACRAGWTCDKAGYIHDEHGCRQPACTATSCPPNQTCGGEFCDAKKCTTSADCDCGACFGGRCQPRPGVCGPLDEPQPPP